jgi:hypothetical protein
MILSVDNFVVEDLHPGDIVRGYHYNEKKIVDFPITAITELNPTYPVRLDYNPPKTLVLSGLTKVLTQGGSTECYKAPWLLGVCHANPRQLVTFTRVSILEPMDKVPTFKLEWDNPDYFLWAEGILVGSQD